MAVVKPAAIVAMLSAFAVLSAFAASFTRAADAPPIPRVEARSSDLLAVGIAQGESMGIHISRVIDNAPVRDASVTVLLRGVKHAAVAEADGSFTLRTPDLALPGAAVVEFQIDAGPLKEKLRGTLQIAAEAGKSEDKNSARQLWWWVLNFAVCIGFLWLISKRRKTADGSAAES